MDVVTLGGCRVHLMPVVRGLVSEGERVRAAFTDAGPEAVALSISREELEGLRDYAGGNAPPDNLEEEVYVRGLTRFGEVRKPPPCFVEAAGLAKERGIPIHPLDMDDEQYTSTYTATVSTVDILLSNARQAKLRRWKAPGSTPEEFVVEWDIQVNGSAGYRKLQDEREGFLARRIRQLSSKYGVLLALVEVERAKGVRNRLG